jgi:hypothetical protein
LPQKCQINCQKRKIFFFSSYCHEKSFSVILLFPIPLFRETEILSYKQAYYHEYKKTVLFWQAICLQNQVKEKYLPKRIYLSTIMGIVTFPGMGGFSLSFCHVSAACPGYQRTTDRIPADAEIKV